MNRRFSLFLLVVLSTASFSFARVAEKPNILLIMADDVGFSDLGCYGSRIQTPNLDALASDGIRFTQFYNTARCCPTRASLLTGLYPHQAGVGHMTWVDTGKAGYRANLNNHCATIAEVLKADGYRTYMAGKWHVTSAEKADSDRSQWPVQRGLTRTATAWSGAKTLPANGTLRPTPEPIAATTEMFYCNQTIAWWAYKVSTNGKAGLKPPCR